MSSARRLKPAAAVNRMTRQWIRSCVDESSVFCAPSVWPLLALLADAAEGRGRKELEHAVGIPADQSRAAALEILGLIREMPAVRSALGLWVTEAFPVDPAWTSGLPLGAVGLLTGDPAVDTPLLNGWVQQNTDGLLDTMPAEVTPETRMLLAAAMSVRTRWVRPFDDWGMPITYDAGPWHGRPYYPMSRVTRVLERVNVAPTNQGEVTCLEVLGHEGVTVHLVLGEEGRPAGEVLLGGLLARTGYGRKGTELKLGDTAPGLVVERVPAEQRDDRLLALVPRFRVEGDHDLVKQPEVFGLETVTGTDRRHFPAISTEPLAVSQARQNAVASFSADGFEAAAVTAIGMPVAGAPPVPPRRVKQIRLEFDRPFGFFATHRKSGLILAAGWVAEPDADQPAFEDLGFEALLRPRDEEI